MSELIYSLICIHSFKKDDFSLKAAHFKILYLKLLFLLSLLK